MVTSLLVTETEPSKSDQVIKSSDQVNGSADGDDVGNDVGKVIGAKMLSATGRAVFDVIQGNPFATVKEISTAIGKSARQVERTSVSKMLVSWGAPAAWGHWKVKGWH